MAKQVLDHVTIHTDGACLGNPGPGGYAAVLTCRGKRRELSGGFRLTTNNRMEIMAAIAGLSALKTRCVVTLHSDSQYLVKAMKLGWARKWKANRWRRNQKELAANPDLWQKLLELEDRHDVKWEWVRGHAGNTENECCDRLSVEAARATNLGADEEFERESGGTKLGEPRAVSSRSDVLLAANGAQNADFPLCQYQRCGGLGRRVVRQIRRARVALQTKEKLWMVCESCADLLLPLLRNEGLSVVRSQLSATPARAIAVPKRIPKRGTLDDAMDEVRDRDFARVQEILAMRSAAKKPRHRRRRS